MNVCEVFIRRPIATSLLMAAIALFGAVAYRALPVSDLPNVDFPTLLVTAQLPGASPETMASSVATPLENQFSNIAGLESMTSVNSLGSTQVNLEFNLDPQSFGGKCLSATWQSQPPWPRRHRAECSTRAPVGVPAGPSGSRRAVRRFRRPRRGRRR